MKRYKLTPEAIIPGGASVKLNYTRGDIVSASGGYLQGIVDMNVANGGVSAPQLLSGLTDINGLTIVLTFDKAMSDPVGKHAEFSFTEDLIGRTFSAAALDVDTTKVVLTVDGSPIDFDTSLVVTYTKGTVTSADTGILESFTQSLSNNVLEAPVAIDAYTDTTGEFIYVVFDHDMADPAGYEDEFDYTEDGTPGTFNAAALAPYVFGETYWEYTLDDASWTLPAVADDGTIYVGSGFGAAAGKLYAINPDGTLKWDYSAVSGFGSSPCIATDGTIYALTQDGTFYALNPNGSLKWNVTLDADCWGIPALAADGTIYIGSYASYKLYALDPVDGSEVWSYLTGGEVTTPCVDSDGTVYFGSRDGFLYAVNPNGSPKWSYDIGEGTWSSPAIDSNGTVFLGADNGTIIAVDSTGVLAWVINPNPGEDNSSGLAIAADGTVYMPAENGFFYALNPLNGNTLWSFDAGTPLQVGVTVGNNGDIYFGGNSGNLFTLDSGGSLVRSFDTGGEFHVSVAIVPFESGGIAYVPTTTGKLYALYVESTGLATSTWPKSGHDNKNTGRVPV